MDYYPWVIELVELSQNDIEKSKELREEMLIDILNEAEAYKKSSRSKEDQKEMEQIIEGVQSGKVWEPVGFSVNFQYIRANSQDDHLLGAVCKYAWPEPTFVFKHKKLPLFMTFGKPIKTTEMELGKLKDSSIKEYLSWAKTMLDLAKKNPKKSKAYREAWIEEILEAIRSYRPDKGKRIVKDSKYITDMLSNKEHWTLRGFAVNLQYVRYFHKNENMMKCVYVHPWGTPPLVYEHKRLPIMVTIGPGIRWNESILKEIRKNDYNSNIEGATG